MLSETEWQIVSLLREADEELVMAIYQMLNEAAKAAK